MATNRTPDSFTITQPVNNTDGNLTVNSDQLRDDEQRGSDVNEVRNIFSYFIKNSQRHSFNKRKRYIEVWMVIRKIELDSGSCSPQKTLQ